MAREVFALLHTHGAILTAHGDRLRVEAPVDVLSAAMCQTIRVHKEALLNLLELWEERSAIAEYCSGLSRAEAEQLAWQCVLGETLEQALRTPVPVHRGDDHAACVALIPAGWSPPLPVVRHCPAPAYQCDASQDQ